MHRRNSDKGSRDRSRQAEQTQSLDDQAKVLLDRMRRGEISPERVLLAAGLRSPLAMEAVGPVEAYRMDFLLSHAPLSFTPTEIGRLALILRNNIIQLMPIIDNLLPEDYDNPFSFIAMNLSQAELHRGDGFGPNYAGQALREHWKQLQRWQFTFDPALVAQAHISLRELNNLLIPLLLNPAQ